MNPFKKSKPEPSYKYNAMLKTNKNWKGRLERDASNFRKTDNAMTLLYYLFISTTIFYVSNLYLSEILINYYVFMIDWTMLLIFAIAMQIALKFIRELSWQATIIQSAQIFIITLLSMILAFGVDIITNETNLGGVWMHVITELKSVVIFFFTTFVFTQIEKEHKKTVVRLENGLYSMILSKNTSINGEILYKTLSDEMVLINERIVELVSIDVDSWTTKVDFDEKMEILKKTKPYEAAHARELFLQWRRIASYRTSYTFGDELTELNIDEL